MGLKKSVGTLIAVRARVSDASASRANREILLVSETKRKEEIGEHEITRHVFFLQIFGTIHLLGCLSCIHNCTST